jgi:predicted site-specific integrase-resolvase
MPCRINDQKYYYAFEVCHIVGISKSTLLRWIKQDIICQNVLRDRRGWRLFTEKDLMQIKAEANKLFAPS